jgi:hypothetical protein
MMIKDGKAIAPESIQTCILYDPKSGKIVHHHQVLTYPGGRRLDEGQVESQALELAAKVRGDASGLRALHVTDNQFQPSKIYRVDLKSRRLVEQPLPKKLRDRLAKLRIGATVKQK